MQELQLSASPPEAGVVDLLKRLRALICHESRSDFRRVLPVYKRLLSHHEETTISVQNKLLKIRAELLACGEDVDVLDVVDRMDRVVERCMQIEEQQKKQRSAESAGTGTGTAPVEEVLRLLVALAGGRDGDTFVLEDPTRVMHNKSNMFADAEKKRIGDRIRMDTVQLLQRSRALFDKAPVPLEDSRYFSPDLFTTVGNGIPSRRSNLWCPDAGVTTTEDGGYLRMMPLHQPNRFIGLPGDPPTRSGFDCNSHGNGESKRQHVQSDAVNLKMLKPLGSGSQLFPSKEVFFFDATREVHCDWRQSSVWGEASSVTENSSWGSESSFDDTEPWIAQAYAWEELGDRTDLPGNYCRPPIQGNKRSLRDMVVPDDFACKSHTEDTPLEVHEADFIEDSLRALSGVGSAIFRRDLPAAVFKLPEKRSLKLPNTTISATTSVLQVFGKAGTTLLRLELISIYYSQDPARGGKTLQAMGDALQLYLSMHRSVVSSIAQECLGPTLGDGDKEDEIISVTKLVGKTRKVCQVLESVGRVFGCDDGVNFWPLLQQGKFPQGVVLLNHLYRHVLSLRVEDATGRVLELMTWFLVKSCSPVLAVISDLIASGRVQESTDPFDEFEVTAWSRNLLEKATSGGGDGLFNQELSAQAAKMLPDFLSEIAHLIVHLSQVQALLRSVDAMSSNHPLVNMRPLIMLTSGRGAVEHAEIWQASIAETVPAFDKTHHPETEPGLDLMGGTCSDENNPCRDSMLEQAEAKRSSQLLQRNWLDEQVLDKQHRELELAREINSNDAKQVLKANKAFADEDTYGRDALLNKYAVLMDGAKERHDYMKWRRDRALRISNAKVHLRSLHEGDMATWIAEKRRSNTVSGEIVDAASLMKDSTSENGFAEAEEVLGEGTPGMAPAHALVTELRTSVKVNTEVGNRTSALAKADDGAFRSSVKVNIKAGNRASASTDDGIWRSSVKVNTTAGNRTSDDDIWRTSVKVNTEAGDRSSVAFSSSAETHTAGTKTAVRILSEPGGSGVEMSRVLYGDSNAKPEKSNDLSRMKPGNGDGPVSGSIDIDMADSSSVVDQSEPTHGSISDERLFHDNASEDVEMEDSAQDLEETRCSVSDQESLPAETREPGETARLARVSLPPVHPFFSWAVPEEDSELLAHVLTKISAEADLTSFASIVDCCVQVPVHHVAHKLEEIAVNWFHNTVQIVEHLRWLRKLMLMSEGLCMDIFARDFLLGLNSATRVNWGVEGRLSSALTLAMIEGSVAVDAISHNFHYRATSTLSHVLESLTMVPPVSSLLSEIELVYDVTWPLGLVITSQSLERYQQMHRFLLYVRLTSLEMREGWGMLRMIRRQGQLSSTLEPLCGGVIYKMQTFLRAFNETFATKVLMTAWSELERGLQKSTTLAELRRCHEEYVTVATRCCFLNTSALSVHSAFLSTLTAAWSLAGFVRGLERQVTGRASEESRIRALCEEYDVALRVLVTNLQTSNSNAERSTREFSECLLLRLNFNQYYSTHDISMAAATEDPVSGADDDVVAEF